MPYPTAYKGIVHCHCNWDDGEQTLEEWWRLGKKRGWSFIYVTLHAGDVDNPIKTINNKKVAGPTGYANFVAECERISKKEGGIVTLVPSIELGLTSHALILGVESVKDFYRGLELNNSRGQLAALDFFYKKEYPVIVAHPDFYRIHPDPDNWRVNKITSYFFDFDSVDKSTVINDIEMLKIDGVELLNYGDNQVAEMNPLFHFGKYLFPTPMVTGGCDFHTIKAEDGLWLWLENQPTSQTHFRSAKKRLTIIWAQSNSVKDLISGLKSAHCAACYTDELDTADLPEKFIPNIAWGATIANPKVYERFSLSKSVRGRYRWWILKASITKGIQLIPGQYQTVFNPESKNKEHMVVLDTNLDLNCYLEYRILEMDTNSYYFISSPTMIRPY